MPRDRGPLWDHFVSLGKKPNTNYHVVYCKHCERTARSGNGNGDGNASTSTDHVVQLEGRMRTMRNHLNRCAAFKASEEDLYHQVVAETAAAAAVPTQRKKRDAVWDHFINLGRKKPKCVYYQVVCKHCARVNGEHTKEIEGRMRSMRNHLNRCPAYQAAEYVVMPTAAAPKHEFTINQHDQQQQPQRLPLADSLPFGSSSATGAMFNETGPTVVVSSGSGGKRKLTGAQKHETPTRKKRTITTQASVFGAPNTTNSNNNSRQDLTPQQTQLIYQRLIELVADNGLPFKWVEKPSTARFIESLCPSAAAVLPSREELSGEVLRNAATAARETQLPKIRQLVEQTGCCLNLIRDSCFDSSSNRSFRYVLAATSEWLSYNDTIINKNNSLIDLNRHDGLGAAQMLEEALLASEEIIGMPIKGVCTEDTMLLQRAKHTLTQRFPHIYFGKCFSHQVNLIVKDVFNVMYIGVVEDVNRLVRTYNNSPTKWLARLLQEARLLYGRSAALLPIIETCWNSAQPSIASVLRIRSALQMVAAKYSMEADFPSELNVTPEFLTQLEESELAIRPLTEASLVMQRNFNTLAHILNLFGRLYHAFAKHNVYSHELVDLLEKRWLHQEQPLFYVAYLLHPVYVCTFRTMAARCSALSVAQMIQLTIFYYKRFISDDYGQLTTQVNAWYHNQYPQAELFADMGPIEFWTTFKSIAPNLSLIAIHILSLPTQSTTCERLFQAFGNFSDSKMRAYGHRRLDAEQVYCLSEIKRHVQKMDTQADQRNSQGHNARILVAQEFQQVAPEVQGLVQMKDAENLVGLGAHESESGREDDIDNLDDYKPEAVDNFVGMWMSALNNLDEDISTVTMENLNGAELAREVLSLKHSDGTEIRAHNPYPPFDDPNYYTQLRLSGIRNIKISLSDLFPSVSQGELPSFHGIMESDKPRFMTQYTF